MLTNAIQQNVAEDLGVYLVTVPGSTTSKIQAPDVNLIVRTLLLEKYFFLVYPSY